MATQVMPCTCKHAAQDKMYGMGNRLHNFAAKGRDVKGWRCTVCGNLKSAAKQPDAKPIPDEPAAKPADKPGKKKA